MIQVYKYLNCIARCVRQVNVPKDAEEQAQQMIQVYKYLNCIARCVRQVNVPKDAEEQAQHTAISVTHTTHDGKHNTPQISVTHTTHDGKQPATEPLIVAGKLYSGSILQVSI
ncbi:hypothetical protein QE152_g37842 [Popillia japonica]|uniref:Uncharacterized protein n=1 Tax=Popillia japonica TaxID=7064 RepID=A0AAW1I9C2_POPJA